MSVGYRNGPIAPHAFHTLTFKTFISDASYFSSLFSTLNSSLSSPTPCSNRLASTSGTNAVTAAS